MALTIPCSQPGGKLVPGQTFGQNPLPDRPNVYEFVIALISRPARSNSSGVRRVGLPKVKPWMPTAI
jgi:hypothetical protein